MSRVYTDECVGCEPHLGCLGDSCPNNNVLHLFCDICGEEVDTLYSFDYQELCAECILNQFEKIEE